ncbi:DUF3617 domain-containing protein [Brevundimonas sp. UBA7534]|uniref:DUF3617 domain-containing protein n=1 Tax=Brevundimonas sp. UBA7534 TaxID=1946138 RepID=UPI0025C048C2|nr:DUF3617 family protein [Brevundimonas sp. UBA7534]
MRIQIALISAAALLAACSNNNDAKAPAETENAGAPAATSAPAPTPGLWEQTISGAAMPQPTTFKVCVGPSPEGANPFNAPQEGVTCSENTVNPAPGGATFRSVCESQGMTVASDGKVAGDLGSAYKVEITSRVTGANVPPQMAQMNTTIDARRLGDCPAGVAPNTIVQ